MTINSTSSKSIFYIEKQKCAFCDRQHKFEISDLVPVQKFEIHQGTVEVQTRILKHDRKVIIRAWDWTLKMDKRKAS